MSELLVNLNQSQQQAVKHKNGPLLILAGAGTGKTTVITSKIAWLVMEEGIRPEEILALTFTEKAAAEMEERVDKLLPLGYLDLWISTFHSFAEKILKEHALEIGLSNDYKLLSQTEQWLLVRQNLDRFNLDYYRPLGNPTKFIHALLKLFSRAKDEAITPEDYLAYVEKLKETAEVTEFLKASIGEKEIKKLGEAEIKALFDEELVRQMEIASAYQTYQNLLLENNALDFGDLINYVLKLFTTRKNILAKYRAQFKYILVDEFQDTNWAQYELVKLLAFPKNNLTVVGDDDQSIYKFRGASISNILQFQDDFPQAKEILLNDNYRSSQQILDLSYQFIQSNNPNRLEARLAQTDKQLSKKLLSQKDIKGEITHLHGQTLLDEVELTVNKIIDLYNSDKSTNWSDFAILVRANAGAEAFLRALDLAKVPYIFMASKGLYGQPIILDLLAWFRLLDDYHENTAMYRILNFNLWQIPQVDIMKINYWARCKAWSLYEVCRNSDQFKDISIGAKEKIKIILSLLEKHTVSVSAGKKPSSLAQDFWHEAGYLKSLVAEDSLENREQLGYLNQFYKKIRSFEQDNSTGNLKNFMELMELELEAGEEGSLSNNIEDSGPDSVKVMTVHASKGLEFKYVFIVNLVDKKFPSISRGEPIELPTGLIKEVVPEGDVHLQEERRLFYVAMTRAKEGLYFTSAVDYGGARSKKLSRFLTELTEIGLSLSAEALMETKPIETVGERIQIASRLPSSEDQLEVPRQFSFTQIKSFENCPYQYRFIHVLKIPTEGKQVFSFGTSMHATMQKFFQLASERKKIAGEKFTVNREELEKIYQETFIEDWYPDKKTKEDYRARGLKSIREFYDLWQEAKPTAQFLEQKFVYKLDRDCSIRGTIDRIDQLADGVRIIDYKTGQPKNKLEADDKDQLLIYQIATEEVLGLKVKELIFHYFTDNSQLSFLGQEKEIEKLKDKIRRIVAEIKRGEFKPDPDKRKCQLCDFKSICDHSE